MSRIEQLIAELCPDGVEFKKLGEITVIKRGERVTKADIVPSGKYPIISGGTKPLGNYDKYNRDPDTITIAQYGTAGFVDWQYDYFWANDVCYSVYPFDILNNRYLYFTLLKLQDFLYSIRTNAVPAHLPIDKLKSIEIPLPPLPIQQEIVRILDTFTDLDAELQAELEARKKQFNFYKEKQFNYCKDSVEWRPLGEVGKFQRGKRFVKNDIVSSGIPCIHYGELYTHYKTWTKETKSYIEAGKAEKLRFAKPGDVIIVTAGETIEDIGNCVAWLGDTDVVIHDACFAYSHNFIPKFVSYYFQTDLFRSQIRRFISSGKISAIHASGLSKATIPIPPLAEQERIASILDKFEALVNEELPAEIAARRKQYEYYREKLLTFKRLVS